MCYCTKLIEFYSDGKIHQALVKTKLTQHSAYFSRYVKNHVLRLTF